MLVLILFLLGSVQQQFELNKEFTVGIGQQVTFKGEAVAVKFLDVKEDSRCPEGAVCAWPGNARIAVTLNKSGKEVGYELNTNFNPKKVVGEGLEIELIRLNPYPKLNTTRDKKAYKAVFLVRKQQ